MTGTHLQSISDTDQLEISAQSPKDSKRETPSPSKSVHAATIWQKIKYLPLYHQTREHLHSPGCKTPQFIINTPFYKIDSFVFVNIVF